MRNKYLSIHGEDMIDEIYAARKSKHTLEDRLLKIRRILEATNEVSNTLNEMRRVLNIRTPLGGARTQAISDLEIRRGSS